MKRCLLILVCLVPLLSASPADALPVLETGLLFPLGLHPEADIDPGGYGLLLCAHLVDDDHLWHVVLHSLYHHGVLPGRRGHLHAPGTADGRVRHIAIPGDLIGGIDDYYPFF